MSNTKLPALPPHPAIRDGITWRDDECKAIDEYARAAILADRERQAGEAVADEAEARLIAQNIREFAQELSLEFETDDLERAADLLESLAPKAMQADIRPNSVEASAMMDSVLAEYGWPTNPKNAARAGFEACRRVLASAPSPDGKAEQAEAPSDADPLTPEQEEWVMDLAEKHNLGRRVPQIGAMRGVAPDVFYTDASYRTHELFCFAAALLSTKELT